MASAIVRIKTAVETNSIVKANKELDGLGKSLKKLATAGWVGAVVAVTKKAADALNACKKAYLEAEGAGTNYAKASDALAKSTERLKKAIGGSLIAGNNGTLLNGLTNAINNVATSLEKRNAEKRLMEEMQSSSYGTNKTADQLWDDFIIAIRTKLKAESELQYAYNNSAVVDYTDLKKAVEEATAAMDRVGALYKSAAEKLQTTIQQPYAQTKSPTTKDEYLKLFTSSGTEAYLLQEAQKLEIAKTQEEAYNILLKSQRRSEDADTYLLKTNSLFMDLVSKRDAYLKEFNALGAGTARGDAAGELAKIFQDAINTMNSNLLSSLPAKVEEGAKKAVDNSALIEWERKQNENAIKAREEAKKEREEKRSNILDSFGSTGSMIDNLFKGSYFTILIDFIGKLVQRANEISPNFNKLLNVVDIFVTALDPLFQIIDKILNPILEMLQGLYMTIYIIASFIKALFVSVVSGFKWVVAAITFDKKGKTAAASEIQNAWNALSGANVQAALTSAFSSSYGGSSSSSGGSGSASYTAARDLYVTINYNNSYVNGDAREIAINLRNEIRAAEAMGY